jgi:hypothetical protein
MKIALALALALALSLSACSGPPPDPQEPALPAWKAVDGDCTVTGFIPDRVCYEDLADLEKLGGKVRYPVIVEGMIEQSGETLVLRSLKSNAVAHTEVLPSAEVDPEIVRRALTKPGYDHVVIVGYYTSRDPEPTKMTGKLEAASIGYVRRARPNDKGSD